MVPSLLTLKVGPECQVIAPSATVAVSASAASAVRTTAIFRDMGTFLLLSGYRLARRSSRRRADHEAGSGRAEHPRASTSPKLMQCPSRTRWFRTTILRLILYSSPLEKCEKEWSG